MSQSPFVCICPEGELLCPCCGENYLHQSTVEVYSRDTEDAPSRATIVVMEAGDPFCEPKVPTRTRGNPSSRRQGLRIGFWCETCDKQPSLTIAQHKGVTYVAWEVPHGDDPPR